jgi:hypothetical protein
MRWLLAFFRSYVGSSEEMQVSANEMVPRPSESAGIDALYLFGVYNVGSQGRRYSGRLGIGPLPGFA